MWCLLGRQGRSAHREPGSTPRFRTSERQQVVLHLGMEPRGPGAEGLSRCLLGRKSKSAPKFLPSKRQFFITVTKRLLVREPWVLVKCGPRPTLHVKRPSIHYLSLLISLQGHGVGAGAHPS